MSEKRYIISDASKLVDVESHVLRYWEEELEIKIPRNEMGHRYYTEFHIKLLQRIKLLKEQGFGLKAIKMLMPELMEGKDVTEKAQELLKETIPAEGQAMEEKETNVAAVKEQSLVSQTETMSKMEQFQVILGEIVSQALRDNNEELSKSVSHRVSDNVIKEMDYLMRMKEEQEEARYKKLDETIRSYQKGRNEAAAAKAEKRRKHKLFGKKKAEKTAK